MKPAFISMAIYCVASFAAASASPGPSPIKPVVPIAAPKDQAYSGEIRLVVDASDLERRIVHVHETLSGVGTDTVLLYPKWLPGTHAPEGPIDRLAGIRITANGARVPWSRDPVDVYALHVHPASGVKSIDIDFDYLSPTSLKVGAIEITRDILLLEWNALVLYPAGYFARQIPVEASLILPLDWKFGSALETAQSSGRETKFKRVSLVS
jgi:predicted metalloprotease with PDZ domain